MALTLLPPPHALKGSKFTFLGANEGEECEGCPFTALCFKLDAGRHYEVTAVRDVEHPCNLHDGDKVRVVEVAETSVQTSLESKLMRGTAATFHAMECHMPTCQNYHLCHPRVAQDIQYQITADEGALDCPAGFDLRKVQLTRA